MGECRKAEVRPIRFWPGSADIPVMTREQMVDEAVRRAWAKIPAQFPCLPGRNRNFYLFRVAEIARAVADIRAEFRRLAFSDGISPR